MLASRAVPYMSAATALGSGFDQRSPVHPYLPTGYWRKASSARHIVAQNVVTYQAHETTREKAEEPGRGYFSQVKGILIAASLRAEGHKASRVFRERPDTHLCNTAQGLADQQRVQVAKIVAEYAESLRELVNSSAEPQTECYSPHGRQPTGPILVRRRLRPSTR